MTFHQMELFVLVCEYKSINRAAEVSYISQQGVSHTIKELEKELGCTLFIRSKKGVTPTKSGIYFLGECIAMLDKRSFLKEHLSNIDNIPVETIHLGMAFGVISALPFNMIKDFEKKHDYIKIDYNDRADYYLERQMLRGDYDFCVTTGIVDSDEVIGECIYTQGIYLCIPPTHLLYTKIDITMDDLRDQSFATFSTQFHIRHDFEWVCKKSGFSPQIEIASNDFNSLREVAINNNFLFVVPAHTRSFTNQDVRYVPFPDNSFEWKIFLTMKKSKVLSDGMTNFYNHIKNYSKLALKPQLYNDTNNKSV